MHRLGTLLGVKNGLHQHPQDAHQQGLARLNSADADQHKKKAHRHGARDRGKLNLHCGSQQRDREIKKIAALIIDGPDPRTLEHAPEAMAKKNCAGRDHHGNVGLRRARFILVYVIGERGAVT